MPLPPSPIDRTHIHTRHISCEAFERADGLWDIDANMVDTKTFDSALCRAGQPLHNMWLRLTLDTEYVIHDVVAAIDDFPQQNCPFAVHPMKNLIGVKIGEGWRNEIRKRIGGALGCTHLRELLAPMATTAMQAIGHMTNVRGVGKPPPGKGSCFAKSDEQDRERYRDAVRVREGAQIGSVPG